MLNFIILLLFISYFYKKDVIKDKIINKFQSYRRTLPASCLSPIIKRKREAHTPKTPRKKASPIPTDSDQNPTDSTSE